MPLLNVEAVYSGANETVTVTGVSGPTETVRVLLNPDLTGVPDNQIFAQFATIPALDKKEKKNAGSWTIVLNAGASTPPFTLVVVTSDGNVERPAVAVP